MKNRFIILAASAAVITSIVAIYRSKCCSKNFFPIGIYGVKSAKVLAQIKSAGFNSFQTYETDPQVLISLADGAKENKLKMMPPPPSDKSVDAKNFPILAWYIADEPELRKIQPADLSKINAEIKTRYPKHKTAFVIGEASTALQYANIADIMLIDWYPVPHLKLETVAHQITKAKGALELLTKPEKPLWAVIQAFNWKEFPQKRKEKIGKFPSFEEIRFMAYIAIIRGSKGIFFYTLDKALFKDKTLLDFPEYWMRVEGIAKELSTMRPIFENGAEEKPIIQFPNELLNTKQWRYKGKTYLIIANCSPKDIPLPPEFIYDDNWRLLFEQKAKLKDIVPSLEKPFIRPYRVLVLER